MESFLRYYPNIEMTKIALIGPSSAGKTTCARILNNGSDAGDMDVPLGTDRCPETAEILDWILRVPVRFVAVSVHVEDPGKGLRGIEDLKDKGADDRLSKIRFVYLSVSREQAASRHRSRSKTNPASQFKEFERDGRLFQRIADATVDANAAPDIVAEKIREIAARWL